jgi:hypothetical protein
MALTSRMFAGIALLVLARGTAGLGNAADPPDPTAAAAEPSVKRFALIGPLYPYHRGHDDRAAIVRLINAAGWTVDYDLPPPGAGKESGQLTGKIWWYVHEDRQPQELQSEDSREVPDKAFGEFLKRETEAIKEARQLGIRPMRIGELLTLLADAGQALPEDRPLAQSTPARLEQTISMSFANETPLEDVLKYIKSATQGPNDTGIPIYVDPQGLVDVEKTLASPVTLDLEGVPLRITLRLLLKQLSLGYTIDEGVLIITSEARLEDRVASQLLDRAMRGDLSPEELRLAIERVRTLVEFRKAMDELRKTSQGRSR